ncbi:MAG: hypothetical protein ABIH80_06430 [Methanobacteriota archaeon]
MIQQLLDIYEQSKLNKGRPECIFAETEIFNEGWLLRGILNKLRDKKDNSSFDFLPFPEDSKMYSEGQLYTPFRKRKKNDKISVESNTPVDGIVGHFELDNTKSGVKILDDFQYLSVFESKMYSNIGERTRYAADYPQVTRIVSCLINQLMNIKEIEKGFFEKEPENEWKEFESKWETIIDLIKIEFITWENILKEICPDASIYEFYDLCKTFNKKGVIES